MGLVSDKNYVAMNAVEAILSTPRKREQPQRWTQKKAFGKVPNYLKQQKPVTENTQQPQQAMLNLNFQLFDF